MSAWLEVVPPSPAIEALPLCAHGEQRHHGALMPCATPRCPRSWSASWLVMVERTGSFPTWSSFGEAVSPDTREQMFRDVMFERRKFWFIIPEIGPIFGYVWVRSESPVRAVL